MKTVCAIPSVEYEWRKPPAFSSGERDVQRFFSDQVWSGKKLDIWQIEEIQGEYKIYNFNLYTSTSHLLFYFILLLKDLIIFFMFVFFLDC